MSRVTASKPLQRLRREAYLEVRDQAGVKVGELVLEDVSLADIKTKWGQFKTALQNAKSPAEIQRVKQNALDTLANI